MSTGIRLDSQLAKLGLARSRNQAQQLIKAGAVLVDGEVETRVGRPISETNTVQVSSNHLPVSRAGLKLEKAMEAFNFVSLSGQIAIDLGAATGGFTQILLKRGAGLVVSVDVGSNQLAAELRNDPRVISLESTDARSITLESIMHEIKLRVQQGIEPMVLTQSFSPALITIDVSFISLSHLLPMIQAQFSTTPVIALFKPQFEVGRHGLGKNGVVRSEQLIRVALEDFISKVENLGGSLLGAVESPIVGQQGNREFLLWIKMQKPINRGELTDRPADWLEKLLSGQTA